MIDLTMNEERLERTVERARQRNIIIPTFEQMKNPDKVPAKIREKLKIIGLWDIDPANLFRITWKNDPVSKGGLFGEVNFLELPREITGTEARIVALLGKWFPTGSHKVGPSLGCLVPRLVTGQFDPTMQKAIWPSTGNFCRGGAYNSQLLACESIAILPEGMSRERFDWLKRVAGEVIATPGSESNVKEIFDKTWELRRTRDNVVAFNQFEEFGNYLWHYQVTGSAIEEAFRHLAKPGDRFFGVALTSGSAGTLAAGDYIKKVFPTSKIVVGEALQCPALSMNGHGSHRIEGIGDNLVPWIHNVRNTDMIIDVDDADSMTLIRLFNESAGREYLRSRQVPQNLIEQLPLLGISGAANLIVAIKMAKYFELTAKDVIFTVFTDSMELYGSRLEEMRREYGDYDLTDAAVDYNKSILGLGIDWVKELSYYDRKTIHNLKYFTWIEQQGKDLEELDAQWYEADKYWGSIPPLADRIDEMIRAFNRRTGLLGS